MRFDEIKAGCKPLEDIERAIGQVASMALRALFGRT